MTTIDTPEAKQSGECCAAPRSFMNDRRVLAVAALGAIGGGAWLGWDWLVAAGAAPIILAVLPCLGMCAAGLCMSKMVGGRQK